MRTPKAPPAQRRARKLQREKSWRFCWWLVCLPLALGLEAAARGLPGFAEGYAQHVYPLLAQPLNAVTGLFPFSVMEVLCAALAVLGLALLVRLVRAVVRAGRGARLARAARGVLRLLCFAGAALLAFVLLAGINYYRSNFTVYSGLTLQEATADELDGLCTDLAVRAKRLSTQVPVRDENGVALTTDLGYRTVADEVDAAYRLAAGDFPELGGSYAHAKPMLFSFVMSRMQLTGIFSPFTLESNVNALAPSFNIPFTAAHELAHLRGFMREDEANYIAWLVCGYAQDVRLQYSGTLMALIHAGNQLAAADPAAYAKLVGTYTPAMRADLAQNNAYWAQFDHQTLSELSESTNNAYLKANGQADGTRSYGRMVDLLLAQWRARRGVFADEAD